MRRAFALSLGLLAPTAVSGQDTPPGDIVVTGQRDIVVHGRAIACRPLPGDPQDRVRVETPFDEEPRESEIARLSDGRYVFEPRDQEHPTASDAWARAGLRIDEYVFRVPTDGRPLCIGGRSAEFRSWGQLRRIVDARPYWGKRVRFTAWVATGAAHLVNFWLVSGWGTHAAFNGGNTNRRSWGGDHGWTPVMLETGPISKQADHISYGFLLHGSGSIWVYKPQLEVVSDPAGIARKGNALIIGEGVR